MADAPVIDWLLTADPAIRWQVLRDLLDAPEPHWRDERARVETQGWGARLLSHEDADGQWDGGAFVPARLGHRQESADDGQPRRRSTRRLSSDHCPGGLQRKPQPAQHLLPRQVISVIAAPKTAPVATPYPIIRTADPRAGIVLAAADGLDRRADGRHLVGRGHDESTGAASGTHRWRLKAR